MTPKERYENYLYKVDPADALVSMDIKRGVRHVYGITDIHHHLKLLHDSACGNVFEIGVRFGVSTSALLSGVEAHGGHLYSVDIDHRCGSAFNHPQWSFKQADSRRDVQAIKHWLPEKLDVLFIDGDHEFIGVDFDLNAYGPMAQVIFLHDASQENPGVLEAVNLYLKKPGCRHKLNKIYTESHGLAVLS